MRTLFITALLVCFTAFAEDDDLTEAPVIQAKPSPSLPAPSALSPWRYRAYAFIEGRWRHVQTTGVSDFGGPYVEADATVDYALSERWKFFFDGMANYSQYTNTATGTLNQVGARWHPHADWVIAAGRERNRRSPGMFVSPSDFLHANPALAGPREIRTGEWVARASQQSENHSTDFLYVPFRRITAGGLPNENPRVEGLVRHFHKVGLLDVDLSAGYLDDRWKAGASVLGFVASVWKFYGEFGYHSTPYWNTLLGAAYEGSDDFSVRAELLYSSAATTTPVPLPAGWNAIVSLAFPEVEDRFNFYLTAMQGLSSNITLGLVRAEWLATSRQTVGTSFLLAPTQDVQWTADWRFSL